VKSYAFVSVFLVFAMLVLIGIPVTAGLLGCTGLALFGTGCLYVSNIRRKLHSWEKQDRGKRTPSS
jgi:hypothetical protein